MRLLIDGDILVYQACAAAQDNIKWDADEGDETVTIYPNQEDAEGIIQERLDDYCWHLGIDEFLIVFSDKECFRNTLMPEYKAHRKDKERPVLLGEMREWLEKKYPSICFKNLEADDTLGILCTRCPEDIVVTIDKDQATVPGKWYNPIRPEWGIRVIDVKEANRNHLIQTMVGDTSDGYKGVPRIGPKNAEKILAHAEAKFLDPWLEVVDTFKGKGLTYEDALLNARMAYILRDGDYDDDTGEVRLWEPKSIYNIEEVKR